MRLKEVIELVGGYRIYSVRKPRVSIRGKISRVHTGYKAPSELSNGVYPGLDDFEVKGISCNSQNVKDNFVFVAIRGAREDGNKFIAEAIERGARAIIVDSRKSIAGKPEKVSIIGAGDARKAAAQLAAEFYGNPSRKIKVVGITGTNGKTTVSYLIEAILKEAGYSPAVIGTVNYRFKDKVILSRNTTPGPVELQSLLADMLREGSDYALTEVSSHALDQDRTLGINFSSVIFTNFSQDHLDYHKTLKNYFQAKAKLFKNTCPGAFAIINNDDKNSRRLKKITPAEIITYGIDKQADITAGNIKPGLSGTGFLLISAKGKTNFKTKLIGRHNVYNILASVSWAQREGIDSAIIKSAVEKFLLVPGRLEKVDFKGSFSIFVDYAHTEYALKSAIMALRQLSPRRIIAVFGCGGERDKTKRPKMGRAASELADYVVLTNDNPRSEDCEAIVEGIKRGIKKDNYCVILDRCQAIKKSLSLAKPKDIVLVAGKGHEGYQILKDKVIPFDDRRIIRECLKSANY